MGREMWDLSDREYLRRDGENDMSGPLRLPNPPQNDNEATRKDYVDNLLATLDTLTPAEIAVLIAALGTTVTGQIAAAVAAYLPLGGGTLTGDLVLNGAPTIALHAATKDYVDSLPVGLSTYDAVVAAAGGDYTSVATACAGEAAGARIFIKRGTYTETGDVTMLDGQMLIGENPEDTIIDFDGAAFKITSAGALTNLTVRDLSVVGSIADYAVELVGDYARVDNCRLDGGGGGAAFDGVRLTGDYTVLNDTDFIGFTRANAYCARISGRYSVVKGNTFRTSRGGLYGGQYCSINSNIFDSIQSLDATLLAYSVFTGNTIVTGIGISIHGASVVITGNFITGAAGITWTGGHRYVVITGNTFYPNGKINCTEVGAIQCVVSGNNFEGGVGIHTASDNWNINGNSLWQGAYISLAATASHCLVTGNNLSLSTNKVVDAGDVNAISGNYGMSQGMDKVYQDMKNTSGGPLVAGDVVVWKAVAAGDEFTTTVNLGDDNIYGMLAEDCANNAYAHVQVLGQTSVLKVNGTVNIGIGDMLSSNNSAGIARKAVGGHMVFAKALEAYAGADDLGVIDAILIIPRKL